MTSRDITVRATRARLDALGYAPTSSTNPDRVLGQIYSQRPRLASWGELDKHPAAIYCYPSEANGCELDDAAQRQVVLLTVTAYLLADARQAKAVLAVLAERNLTAGPFALKPFGDRIYPLAWNHKEPISTIRARLVHEDDDATVVFDQAIPPSRFDSDFRRLSSGAMVQVALKPYGSQILALDGVEWKGGHILDTPRRNLPELLEADVREIVADVERARWGARPALARDAVA